MNQSGAIENSKFIRLNFFQPGLERLERGLFMGVLPRTALERNTIGARLCAKHQPQHDEKLCGIRRIPAGWFCEAAAAGLRHSRAPGAVPGIRPKRMRPTGKS